MRLKMKGLAARLYYSCPEKLYHAYRPGCGRLTLIATATWRLAPGARMSLSPSTQSPRRPAGRARGWLSEQLTFSQVLQLTSHPSRRMFSTGSQYQPSGGCRSFSRAPNQAPCIEPSSLHSGGSKKPAHISRGRKRRFFCWQPAISSWHLADLLFLPSRRGALNGYTRSI